MDTTLKEFAEAFDVKEPLLQILMTYDTTFFEKNTSINEKKQVVLNQIALDMLEDLYSNQADKISVSLAGISKVIAVPADELLSLIQHDKTKNFNRMISKADTAEETTIKFKAVSYLLNVVKKSANGTPAVSSDDMKNSTLPYEQNETDSRIGVEDADNSSETILNKPKTRSVRKKKSKYSMTKTKLNDFSIASVEDIKAIRMFLISTGDYKMEEIAVKSDSEINELFSEKFVSFKANENTIIVEKSTCLDIMDKIFVIPD